jgi:iron complex transport system permease protein
MSRSDFLAAHAPRRLTRARLAAVLGGCALATLAVALLAPLFGVATGPGGRHLEIIDLGEVLRGGTASDIFIMARLPRVLGAMLVGAALAGSGCAFQAVLRNPLAEPYTLGISSGSALAAVIAIRLGLDGTLGGNGVGIAAMLGAMGTVLAVWRLGRVGGALPAATLLLAGVTIAMFCSAGSMLVQYTADFAEVTRMLRWMMGGFEWIRYGTLARAAVPIGIGLVALLALARDLNALSAGAEAAASVGVPVARSLTIAFATASMLVGGSIAIGGPIGFVGLLVPHALRALIGADHRVLLPASMLVGGAALVVFDTGARMVIAPTQLPVGVVTALMGGPFFLLVLVRHKRRLV